MKVNIALLTVTDTRTFDNDKSGAILVSKIKESNHNLLDRKICKDNKDEIVLILKEWLKNEKIDAIITTGGTGLTGRDITPEALDEIADKQIPGFGEVFRSISLKTVGTSAIQSRACAVLANGKYIFALPGSSGGVTDAWEGILKHQLDINEENISLMMGDNCHLVVYPVNKKNELNLVCIIRDKKYNPDNINSLIEKKVLNQNSNLRGIFNEDLKSWPLYFTPRILPSTNSKVFYIGDAFNGFLPTLAQGAGQSIESAHELFNLIKDDKAEIQNTYFKERSRRAKIVKRRSNINFFAFAFTFFVFLFTRNFMKKFLNVCIIELEKWKAKKLIFDLLFTIFALLDLS